MSGATALIELHGHQVSRSAIGRYARRLKASDAIRGLGTAPVQSIKLAPAARQIERAEPDAVVAEILRLQALQTALLRKLQG